MTNETTPGGENVPGGETEPITEPITEPVTRAPAAPAQPPGDAGPPRFQQVPGHFPVQAPVTIAETATSLTDGEWRRMHPATPFLRGGLALVAIVGILIANLRDQAVSLFVPEPDYPGADTEEVEQSGFLDFIDQFGGIWVVGSLGILLVIAGIVAFSYFSWRRNTYRVTGDAVEVRSGILNRQHRQAPLDRIQGVNINKPMIARLMGAAKLTVATAGQGSNVELSYLKASDADELRRGILGLVAQHRHPSAAAAAASAYPAAAASAYPAADPAGQATPDAAAHLAGAYPTAAGAPPHPVAPQPPRQLVLGPDGQPLPGQIGPDGQPLPGGNDLITRRFNEFFAPEPDLLEVEPESIVRIPPVRLIASLVYNWGLAWVLAALIFVIVFPLFVPDANGWIWFAMVPFLIAMVGTVVSQSLKMLKFSIAQTRDGVRIGYGLLSTTNETIPPGRIHAIEVHQPLLWRGLGWWSIRITRAGMALDSSGAAPMNTLLPVGSRADVERVLAVLMPQHSIAAEVIEEGLTGADATGGYTGSPKRAAIYLLWGRRRNGVQITNHTALIRHGVFSRRLVAVPLARVQSVRLTQGWLARQLKLTNIQPQVVLGTVNTLVQALDRDTGIRLLGELSAAMTAASAHDDQTR